MVASRIMGLLAAVTIAGTATAQQPCGPREEVVALITDKYGEQPRGIGRMGPYVFEVFGNDETGSWSILRTDARGVACIGAAGRDWHTPTPKPAGEGA